MGKNVTCDFINLSRGVEELIGDIPKGLSIQVSKAVEKSAKYGAKQLRNKYATGGKHDWSDEYRRGFTCKIDRSGSISEGVVGNKAKPGLVHLLEKGHLTLTGRRTQAYPHMDPAFDDMQEKFIEEAEKAIDRALEG